MTTTETICSPWRDFKYNSRKVESQRHAGPLLAKDLAIHNATYRNLKCPPTP